MQSRWKTWPQLPQATERPSSEAVVGLAWYSMLGSCSVLRQMAQVSVQMDHDQTATAFHFFTCGRKEQRGLGQRQSKANTHCKPHARTRLETLLARPRIPLRLIHRHGCLHFRHGDHKRRGEPPLELG